MSTPAATTTTRGHSCVTILLGLLGLLFFGACVLGIGQTDNAPRTSPDRMDAYLACQRAVETQLVAPSTAEFAAQNQAQYTVEGKRVFVTGTVQADNRFGVPLEHVYTCALDWQGGSRYTLVDLLIKER